MDYLFESFENSDLIGLFNDPARLLQARTGKDPAVDFADDGREITAQFLGFRRRYDDTYVLYAYRYKNVEYGFLWETFFDEAHRAADGGEPHVWYDDIREGDFFPVRVRLKDPKQHVILDGPFLGMNDSTVIVIVENDLAVKRG